MRPGSLTSHWISILHIVAILFIFTGTTLMGDIKQILIFSVIQNFHANFIYEELWKKSWYMIVSTTKIRQSCGYQTLFWEPWDYSEVYQVWFSDKSSNERSFPEKKIVHYYWSFSVPLLLILHFSVSRVFNSWTVFHILTSNISTAKKAEVGLRNWNCQHSFKAE